LPNPTLQVFDKNLKRTGTLIDAYNIERRRRLNSDYELSFLVPMTSEDYLEKIQIKGHVRDERGQYYVINTRQRQRDKKKLTAQITCTHVMFKLNDYKVPYDEYIDEAYGIHISTLLNKINAWTGGRFTFQIHDTFDMWDIKDFGRTTALAALNQVINTYKAEIRPDNFVIHIYKKIGSQNDRYEYRTKKNIISDSFKDDSTNLVTRMYAHMKDGRTWVGMSADNLTAEERSLLQSVPGAISNGKIMVNYLLSPYVNYWGSDSVPFFDGENIQQDIEDPVELLKSTREELRKKEMPELEVTVTAADLYKIDREEHPPDLGDAATVYDPQLGLQRIAVRIVELTEYPYSIDQHSNVTLANFALKDDIDLIADLERSRKVMDNLLSGGRIRTEVFEAFAKQAVIDINNSKTEIKYEARGIVLESKPNPLDQVIMTSNGIILSRDGGRSAMTAITAEGIAAPAIIGQLGSFVSMLIGSGNNITQINTNGIAAGHANFSSAPFRVDMQGNVVANRLTANSANIYSSNFTNGAIVGSSINVGNGMFTVSSGGHMVAQSGEFRGSISASTFDGGTITGALIRTAASGRRIEVDAQGLRTYDGSGRNRITISTGSDYGVAAVVFNGSGGGFAGEINSYQDGGLTMFSSNITIGSNNTGNPISLQGAATFAGPARFNSTVSGITLNLTEISGLESRLISLQGQIDSLRNSFNSHTHSVYIPSHNHGNPQNQNWGDRTFTTSTP
jgi:hypothetical protein